ncbi:MAG TPA: hypothetical protein VFU37_01475 [Pyrinomonadaceae bacterium]|nr:hypothetical protein [Pyrinomonadaceae bacterium]
MTPRLRTTFLFILFLFTASFVHAQSAGTTHIFPQIVDGVSSDGSAFTSRFLIASIGGFPATCDVSLFGLGPERLSASASVLVQPASWQSISTRGQDVLAAGYARLNCSQPVFASLTYSLQSANGASLGIATVPGAPVASHALIPMVLNGRYRYGIAIANDNDAPLTVALSFESNGTAVLRSIQVAARSHYVTFVDEIFTIPAEGAGTFEILANGSTGSDHFNITALLFDQGGFTNVVPAVVF